MLFRSGCRGAPQAAVAAATPAAALPDTPATNPPEGGGYGPVPKTLPPEDEAPPAAAASAAPGMEISAQAASVYAPVHPGTPLGGFSRSVPSVEPSTTPHTPGAVGTPHTPGGTTPDARPPSDHDLVATPGSMASWQNGAQNGGAAFPPTADYEPPPPVEMSPRPGGTDIGGSPNFTADAQHVGAGAPFTAAGGGVYGAGTAPMDPMLGGGPARSMARPRKAGGSLALILLLATVVSGAVVGGVYLAHRYAQPEDSRDDPPIVPAPPPPALVTGAPQPADPPPPVTPPPVVTKPPPAVAQPKPSGTPKPGPAPTTTATSGPAQIPPPVLPGPITFPTGPIPFPFPFPGQTATPAPGPAPGPTTNPGPGPGPAPTGNPTGRPHIVIKVPKPGSSVRIGTRRLR